MLISAAEKGYDEIVDMIIRHHGPGDEEVLARGYALMLAARNGHVTVVKSLLRKTPINKNVTDKCKRANAFVLGCLKRTY